VGNITGAVAAIVVSPYKLRLRFSEAARKRYFAFSWPIFVTALSLLILQQGQVLAFNLHGGLEAAGYITLAFTLTRYADRADQIITTTIYPAICVVAEQIDTLEEIFVKSNRVTMMWAFPFGAGFVLFAPDLVHFILGHKWEPAVVLLQGLGAAAGLQQLGYNWFSFYRARGRSTPQAVESAVLVGGFLAFAVPGLIVWGSAGFIWGRLLATACVLAVRRAYVKALLPRIEIVWLGLRGLAPVLLGSLPVVALRFALWGGSRSGAQAIAEIVLFVAGTALATCVLERGLLGEMRDYLRRGSFEPLAEASGNDPLPAASA
jgi:O-antigen/teichoic acid export membrane protein